MNELSIRQQSNPLYYRINVKTFFDFDGDGTGDLIGVLNRLPYLVALGVDAIVLEDVLESDKNGTTDFIRLSPSVGTREDLDALISGAHLSGLKLLLSLPLRYTSTAHSWFEKSAVSSSLNPYREYYTWGKGKDEKGKNPPDNRKNLLGASAWTHYEKGIWYLNFFGEGKPALNYDNPRLRKEVLEAIGYWINCGADGFVLENSFFTLIGSRPIEAKNLYNATEELFGADAPYYRLLRDVKEKCEKATLLLDLEHGSDPKVYPYLISHEMSVADALILDAPLEQNSLSLKGFSLKSFVKSYLTLQSRSYPTASLFAFEDARHARLLSDLAPSSDCSFAAAKMLSVLLFCGKFLPVLYQGEELGMYEGSKKSFEPCALAPFQWDNRPFAGFTQGDICAYSLNENYRKINMTAESSDSESPLSFYQKMIAFRKSSEALSECDFEDHSKGNVVAFLRPSIGETLLVIANVSESHLNFKLPAPLSSKEAECLLSTYALVGRSLHESIGLRPFEARIYRLK